MNFLCCSIRNRNSRIEVYSLSNAARGDSSLPETIHNSKGECIHRPGLKHWFRFSFELQQLVLCYCTLRVHFSHEDSTHELSVWISSSLHDTIIVCSWVMLDSSQCKSLVSLAPFVAFMLAQSMTVFPSAVSRAPILKVCVWVWVWSGAHQAGEGACNYYRQRIQTWLH